MRKRARVRISEDELDPNDHISSLPDDILISILSRLTLKEAAVTSSLSRQWRYLWTQVTSLDFDGNSALDRIAADPKLRSIERPKYINWLNRVMRQYRGPTLDSVKICFDLDKNSKSAIDNWIKFAIAKRVQMLELDLLENGETLRQPMRNYTLPQKHLWPSKRGSSLKNVCSYVMRMQPCMSAGLKYLQALSLKCVNVSEETLDHLLSDCPVLQHLSIHGSGDLVNVKVSGTSLRLKHLELVFCLRLETIEISDVNLVSFSYLGHVIDLTVKNVPKLDEVSIGEGYSGLEKDVFGQLSCCLHQLESLTLDIYRPMENLKLHAFPELPNLKQLIIKVGAWEDDSLLELTSLIKQCQNLNRFVLQLIWMSPSKRRRKIRRAPTCTHTFLERVEIVGYYGRTSDAELVMYFIENAVALRKIIIDPRNQILDRSSKGTVQIKKEESARRCAMKQLETKKPPGVQLIIL